MQFSDGTTLACINGADCGSSDRQWRTIIAGFFSSIGEPASAAILMSRAWQINGADFGDHPAVALGLVTQFGSVTVGTASSGNCLPFNCNFSGSASGQAIDYVQIYSASAFSGVTTFDTITFFDTFGSGGPTVASGPYTITFGTTTAPLGATFPFAQTNVATFFSGPLGGLVVGGSFSIPGVPYSYDPLSGNLLMEVIVTDQQTDTSGFFGFDSDVQTFPSPTPDTLLLFATGLSLMGWFGWRKRRKPETEAFAI